MTSYKKICWSEADVKCPFYKKDSREERSISCEGFDQGSTVVTKFKNLGLRENHMGCYCVGRFQLCPIYKSTYDFKYREDGA